MHAPLELSASPGFPGHPISRAEVERKFRSNIGKRLPKQRTDDILQALWAIEQTNNLPSLLGKLTLQT
jgi:2-methylcitrate dehydratase